MQQENFVLRGNEDYAALSKFVMLVNDVFRATQCQ